MRDVRREPSRIDRLARAAGPAPPRRPEQRSRRPLVQEPSPTLERTLEQWAADWRYFQAEAELRLLLRLAARKVLESQHRDLGKVIEDLRQCLDEVAAGLAAAKVRRAEKAGDAWLG